jgi:hypothetical protein
MLKRFQIFLSFLFIIQFSVAQQNGEDTIFLMNGHVIGQRVVDTTLGAVSILNPKKISSRIHYEWDQLYMVKFANGYKRYYYVQDSTINNWFTRDEMWMYMKGENDARKGFKAKGSLIGAGIVGFLGGMTGTFWGPIAPYGYMALSGITKVRIRHNTVSDPRYLESDPYILGYERVARQRRKIWSLMSGTAGLILGYSFYAAFHQHYPETINFGFNKK